MSTPAQPGKREYQAAIRQARGANDTLRDVLRKLTTNSSPLVQALVNKAALSLLDSESALNRLDEIGRNYQENS